MQSIIKITANDDYNRTAPDLEQIRDVMQGSPCVKVKGKRYLEHPSLKDEDDGARYREIKQNAEFDDFTAVTERVMIGRMALGGLDFEPPADMPYMIEDVDQDGLSMRGLVESCVSNVLQAKYHILLTEFNGVGTLPIDVALSQADIDNANLRPTIKQYPREALIDWDFGRINGTMQFTYMLIEETDDVVDPESGSRNTVTSYIKLALDENGDYYQQKRTDCTVGNGDYGERNYVTVSDGPLKYIPVSVASDSEFTAGELPLQMGYLAAIGELAIQRYRTSAKYKECLGFVPSVHGYGIDAGMYEEFVAVNKRSSVASGPSAINLWSGNKSEVGFEVINVSGDLARFETYFEDNKNKVKALGGVFKTNATVQRTATEIIEEASTIVAILHPVADSTESAIKWQLANCAVMSGHIKQTDRAKYVEDLDFKLPREFASSKLAVEEVKALLDVYGMGLLPKEEFVALLVGGGWTISNAEDLISKLDNSML